MDKKNKFPAPPREAVKTSYILFIAVLILMLIFCALFLSPASADGGRGATCRRAEAAAVLRT